MSVLILADCFRIGNGERNHQGLGNELIDGELSMASIGLAVDSDLLEQLVHDHSDRVGY